MKVMRIAYCTNVRLPSERAHGHQIAQVCAALNAMGHDLSVYAPFRKNPIKEKFHVYYDLRDTILFSKLGDFDPINRWWLPGPLGLWTLNFFFRPELKQRLRVMNDELLYTRTPALLGVLLSMRRPVILELHSLPTRGRAGFVRRCNRCALVVCLTNAMREELIRWGVESTKVVTEGDAFDPQLFRDMPNSTQTKTDLNLNPDLPVIGYTGQLASMGLSKGLPELLDALRLLQKKNIPFQALIAGGPDSMKKELEESLEPDLRSRVRFLGWVPHGVIAHILAACDVLVYPAPKSSHPYYQRDVSPLKIFEYMAARKPVVCADLPPLRDVVDSSVVALCEPGNAESCAAAIYNVLEDPGYAQALADKAHQRVQRHTWPARMDRIMTAAGYPQ